MTTNNKLARIAGISFLTIVIGYSLTWILVYSRIISPGNVKATFDNIVLNQMLFRLGIVGDLIIGFATIILAWTLYLILKTVNQQIALLGLGLRFIEGFLAIVTVSFSYMSLQLIGVDVINATSKTEQINNFIGIFLNLHTTAATIPMVFTGIGSIVFLVLLFKSNYVPKLVSGFGIFSYILILAITLVKLFISHTTNNMLSSIELIIDFPSVLFELFIGCWLIIKGIKE
jgi:hypothetical protein